MPTGAPGCKMDLDNTVVALLGSGRLQGMTGHRRGSASAEMLIVLMIVIGVLAAVGLQKYAALSEKAHVAVMVDNLRNLAASEEAYFADHASYYGGELPSTALAFVPRAM